MEYTREEKFLIWLDSFLSLDYARKAKIAALSEGGRRGSVPYATHRRGKRILRK